MNKYNKRKKKPYLYRLTRYYIKCLLLLFIPNENGGNTLTMGLCWSINNTPTIEDNVKEINPNVYNNLILKPHPRLL